MSPKALQTFNSKTDLKGCSALKILDVVGWEKGTFESNMEEEPVNEWESDRSVGVVFPF